MKQEIFQSYLSSFPAGFDFDFGILATLNLINFLFKFVKKKKKKRKEKKKRDFAEFSSRDFLFLNYAELILNKIMINKCEYK